MSVSNSPRAVSTKGKAVQLRVAIAAVAGVTISVGVFAAPASAAPAPSFEIFYSPDCSAGASASRSYDGYNAGESWINDTFTSSRFGGAGFGQLIRNNAASIYVANAYVSIRNSDGAGWGYGSPSVSAGQCFNLNVNLRNRNTDWVTTRAPY